jgi:hypothetical protein
MLYIRVRRTATWEDESAFLAQLELDGRLHVK